jgi:hypothetical protein
MEENSDLEVDHDGAPRRPRIPSRVCRHCGKKGHTTTRSKKCLHYKGADTGPANAAAVMTTEQEVADNAREQFELDALPIQDDEPSDISLSQMDFQEAFDDPSEGIQRATL